MNVEHEPPDPRMSWAGGFGADAERYDRARPRYPEAMVRRILEATPGRAVLDVGCGTGIAARQFRQLGAHVLGVEPDARMAELARATGLEVEVARFEEWAPQARRFDAVIAGQAWHWIDPAAGAAQAAGVLAPGGRVALFWNVFAPPPEVRDAFASVYSQVMTGPLARMWERPALDGYSGVLARAREGLIGAGFEAVDEWRYEWEWHYSTAAWLDQLPTFGGHTQLADEQLALVSGAVGDAIDGFGGGFAMGYTTVVLTAAVRVTR